MRRVLIATAASAALLSGGTVLADTTGTTFPVSATVLKTCSVTASPMAFGNYTPGAGALAATSTVAVTCTKTTGFTVALNGGTTAGATPTLRLLANGANTLQYNLYTTLAGGTIWGDGSPGTQTQAGVGNGLASAVPLTVYGQLPDNAFNQAAAPLAYTDTIAVTVTY